MTIHPSVSEGFSHSTKGGFEGRWSGLGGARVGLDSRGGDRGDYRSTDSLILCHHPTLGDSRFGVRGGIYRMLKNRSTKSLFLFSFTRRQKRV